jgi:hypothetical protein
MLPKKGIHFPNPGQLDRYSRVIAGALKVQLGSTHQATKTVMAWTGVAERTAKNWLSGTCGPSGDHLIELIRHSDCVLEALLMMSGRVNAVGVHRLVDIRGDLVELVKQIDLLLDGPNRR